MTVWRGSSLTFRSLLDIYSHVLFSPLLLFMLFSPAPCCHLVSTVSSTGTSNFLTCFFFSDCFIFNFEFNIIHNSIKKMALAVENFYTNWACIKKKYDTTLCRFFIFLLFLWKYVTDILQVFKCPEGEQKKKFWRRHKLTQRRRQKKKKNPSPDRDTLQTSVRRRPINTAKCCQRHVFEDRRDKPGKKGEGRGEQVRSPRWCLAARSWRETSPERRRGVFTQPDVLRTGRTPPNWSEPMTWKVVFRPLQVKQQNSSG